LFGSAVAFATLRGVDAALPLLRRSIVREALGERGLREAAVQRLRSSRYVYEDLVWVLTIVSAASASALVLAFLVRETGLAWPLLSVALVGSWFALLLAGSLVEPAVAHLPLGKLVIFGVAMQFLLWPLLPLRRVVQPRWGRGRAGSEGNGTAAGTLLGTPDSADPELQVEEEIAEDPLELHERVMIHAILHLDETPVREIMVPRVDVISLDVTSTLEQAVPRMLESGHSRLPVYEDDQDNVVGILYSRDLLAATTLGKGASPPVLRDLMRPCFFVPESKHVDEMLTEFQERRVHLAVVIDEYGGVAGIVTIEDLLEEIVGEIEDEFDFNEPNVERGDAGGAVVDARMSIDKFNEEFKTEISPEGFDTLGGLMFSRLGRIPTAGDIVEEGGLRMQVATTVGRRIKKVRIAWQTEPAQVPVGPEYGSESS
jgi:CBS domain containing-hemolysin-like protein